MQTKYDHSAAGAVTCISPVGRAYVLQELHRRQRRTCVCFVQDDVIGGLLLEPWAGCGPSLFVRTGSAAMDSGHGGGIVKIIPPRQPNLMVSSFR